MKGKTCHAGVDDVRLTAVTGSLPQPGTIGAFKGQSSASRFECVCVWG